MTSISRRNLVAGAGVLGLAGLEGGCKQAAAENAWRQLPVGSRIDINGVHFEAECGQNPAAIQAYNSKYIRFTMIPGNGWEEDDPDGNERAELDGWRTRFPPRTPLWAAWSMYYEPGPWSTSDWCILRQIYPWSGLVLKPQGVLHWAGGSTGVHRDSFPTRFQTRLEQGKWFHIVERVVLDPDGGEGHWQSWLNGQKVLDMTEPFGTAGKKDYWFKFGIYRGKFRYDGTPAKEVVSIRYANVRFGTEDLSALIGAPESVDMV